MGVEQRSPAITPEHNTRQRPGLWFWKVWVKKWSDVKLKMEFVSLVKSVPTVEIYRPPAARRAAVKEDQAFSKQDLMSPESADW